MSAKTSLPPLSPREKDIVGAVANGLTADEIAAEFGLSARTVQAHRANVYRKLRIGTTAELVKYAIRVGLTTI